MAHQVIWTKKTTDFVVENAGLTDFERNVLLTRISGMTQIQQAFFFQCGVSTIKNTVSVIKKKYDALQKEYPDTLKPRARSAAELYMDTH